MINNRIIDSSVELPPGSNNEPFSSEGQSEPQLIHDNLQILSLGQYPNQQIPALILLAAS